MGTAGGGWRRRHVTIAFGVLILPQLLTAAPSQPVTSGRAQQALQSFCQTLSGRNVLCGPLGRAKRSTNVIWNDLLRGAKRSTNVPWRNLLRGAKRSTNVPWRNLLRGAKRSTNVPWRNLLWGAKRSTNVPWRNLLRGAKRSTNVSWSDLLTNPTVQMPDTKWCGAGDAAASYDDLGRAEATDRCCREHDHCPVSLVSGETRAGVTNTGRFTRSDCECETEFFNCLVEASTVHSQLVGELYFNILGPDCIKNVTSRWSRREGPGQKEQQLEQKQQQQGEQKEQQQQLRLVKSPLAGQYPDQDNEEDTLDKAEDLVVRAWSELVRGRQSDSDHGWGGRGVVGRAFFW